MAEWIDTKDVARLIRADLKAELKGVKFSVRISRYSMGSNVRVAFKNEEDETDSNIRTAREICVRYKGKGFDGMTDSTYYIPIIIEGEEYSAGCYVFLNSSKGYSL